MRGFCMLVLTALLSLAGGTAVADANKAGKLPPPARVGCGDSGVAGAGFTVYACESGAGGTKYAHWPELLVVRTNGSYRGYRDAFSQAEILRKLANGEVVATHNNAVVQVTASGLGTLVGERQLDLPGSPRLGYIDSLTVDSAGDIFLRANYYARNRHGCENARWERKTAGHLTLRWRSKTGLTCG
jgi:hypothetical protein